MSYPWGMDSGETEKLALAEESESALHATKAAALKAAQMRQEAAEAELRAADAEAASIV